MKCPNCGKEIADSSKFCGFCGMKMSAGAKPYVWLWVSLCLCLTAVAVAVIVWVVAGSHKPEEVVTTQTEEVVASEQVQEQTTQQQTTKKQPIQQSNKGNYYVVAGWFEELNNALAYLQDLQNLGYTYAFMLDWDYGYRVIATRASSKSEATSKANMLERDVASLGTDISPFVVKGNKNESSYHFGRINDSDGWSNVRADQSRDAEVLLRLGHGTKILYKTTSSGWYEVYDPGTSEFYGYVHKSCIQ